MCLSDPLEKVYQFNCEMPTGWQMALHWPTFSCSKYKNNTSHSNLPHLASALHLHQVGARSGSDKRRWRVHLVRPAPAI